MPNCTYKYFDKSSKPPPLLPLEKFAKISLLETARRPDRKFSRRLFPTKARKNNNTGFRQSEKKKKKKKMYPPRGETNVSRNSYQEIPSPRPAFTGATCLAAWKNAIFRTTCEYVAEIQERNAYEGGIQFSLSLLRFARIYHTKQKRGEAS